MTSSKAWIYVVLVCFIGLIIPKEIWHDCDHVHQLVVHDHDHKLAEFSKDTSCVVCDFHFYAAVENQISEYSFSKMRHPNLELLVDEFNLVVKTNISLRGPPECLIEA